MNVRAGSSHGTLIRIAWMAILCSTFSSVGWAEEVEDVVDRAFVSTHGGWSSDEVLTNDKLNDAFLQACRVKSPGVSDREFNWVMLNLRKAGRLSGEVTRRRTHKHDAYRHAAEIAARLIEDRHHQNIDRTLCDPRLRLEFDTAAQALAPNTSTYLLRKAALSLRKAHQLRPELVVRVADWDRTVTTMTLAEATAEPGEIPEQPGVYLFLDSTGYLYIGEAANLRKRITKHTRDSDRPTLAKYLREHSESQRQIQVEFHAFDPKSPARLVSMRRAYESELIRSRKPRFNSRALRHSRARGNPVPSPPPLA